MKEFYRDQFQRTRLTKGLRRQASFPSSATYPWNTGPRKSWRHNNKLPRTLHRDSLYPPCSTLSPVEKSHKQKKQFQMQSLTQVGFPFNMTNSSNLLLIPARQRQSIRLLPTVMPSVAGYCDICGKCNDQIALETLGDYLVATEYEGETVKETAIRSRAFIHGFEAALFLSKNAGLSHPSRYDGSVVQL